MDKMRIVVLGVTGSIGAQTLDVVRMHPDKLEIVGIACGKRVEEAVAYAREFGCKNLAFGDENVRGATILNALDSDVHVGFGPQAVADLVQLDDVDVVLNALVGEAGMRACRGRGYVYAQIGVDCTPCPKNCRFCSYAAVNIGPEPPDPSSYEVPIGRIVHFAKLFDDTGVHLLSLMATTACGSL